MLILELYWHVYEGRVANRYINSLMEVLQRKRENVSDLHIEHSKLISKRLTGLLDDQSNSTWLVKGPDYLVINQLKNWCISILNLVSILNDFSTLPDGKLSLATSGDDSGHGSWRKHEQMGLLILICNELRDSDVQLLLNLEISRGLEPVGLILVEFGVLNGHPNCELRVSSAFSLHIDA
jgi:hypothetical protein